MPGWLKVLIGIVVAIPVGAFLFVWYLERAFESGGCRETITRQADISADVRYRTVRLRCSGSEDEFVVAVGPSDGMVAALTSRRFEPKFVRADNARLVVFSVDGRDIGVTLDGLGQPIERIDIERDGRRSATPHPR